MEALLLEADADEIDLLEVLQEFHIQMLQSYGNFVATTFFLSWSPRQSSTRLLTEEVKRRDPNARMVFFEHELEVTHHEGGKVSVNATAVFPPNSLFENWGSGDPNKDLTIKRIQRRVTSHFKFELLSPRWMA